MRYTMAFEKLDLLPSDTQCKDFKTRKDGSRRTVIETRKTEQICTNHNHNHKTCSQVNPSPGAPGLVTTDHNESDFNVLHN